MIGAWFGTNALHYTAVDLMMSHAAALFSTAWCGYEAVTLSESLEHPSKWFRLGVSCALVCLIRYQNAVFLAVPFAAVFAILSSRSSRRAAALIRYLPYAALGFVFAIAPQLVTWKSMFGSWIANSYQREFAFTWRGPHLLDILFRSVSHGLVIWLPVLAIGILGCLAVAAERANVVAMAASLAWLINIYIISSWWAWEAIAQRAAFDFLLPIGLGMGALLTLPRGGWLGVPGHRHTGCLERAVRGDWSAGNRFRRDPVRRLVTLSSGTALAASAEILAKNVGRAHEIV